MDCVKADLPFTDTLNRKGIITRLQYDVDASARLYRDTILSIQIGKAYFPFNDTAIFEGMA